MYAPELDKRIRPHLQPANDLWKVDETYSSRTRQKFVAGVEFALSEAPRSGGKRKIDGKAEAFLVATVCSDPPQD
ncbi:helix-turn-helix domain-containing protein [Cyanobacteria bacterium FACHB-471]|nr:helix-turn-helix domain-containing protein [Cyanobacteria bacterium FACHB-471]